MSINTAIKLREQFKGNSATKISFHHNKKRLIISVLMYNALLLVLAISLGGLLIKQAWEFLVGIWFVLAVFMIFISFYFYKKIKANKAILTLDKEGIQISSKPFLAWKNIKSIQIIYHRGTQSNAHQYYLDIRANAFKWQMNIQNIAMEMDEICHWIAYFKKQRN